MSFSRQQLTTQDRIILGEVVLEEALLLRVRDKALADAIRRVLRDEETLEDHLKIVMNTPLDALGEGKDEEAVDAARERQGEGGPTQDMQMASTSNSASAGEVRRAPVSEVNGTLEFQGKKYQLTKLNMVSMTAVSYTHLTLPTIYSV